MHLAPWLFLHSTSSKPDLWLSLGRLFWVHKHSYLWYPCDLTQYGISVRSARRGNGHVDAERVVRFWVIVRHGKTLQFAWLTTLMFWILRLMWKSWFLFQNQWGRNEGGWKYMILCPNLQVWAKFVVEGTIDGIMINARMSAWKMASHEVSCH